MQHNTMFALRNIINQPLDSYEKNHAVPCCTGSIQHGVLSYTSNKNIHFEMILDVGIGEKRKETRF